MAPSFRSRGRPDNHQRSGERLFTETLLAHFSFLLPRPPSLYHCVHEDTLKEHSGFQTLFTQTMKIVPAQWLFARSMICAIWESKKISFDEAEGKRGRYVSQKIVIIRSADVNRLQVAYQTAVRLLESYRIFPPSRMRAKICSPTGKIQHGATIIQQIAVGLIGFEAAVRVIGTHTEKKGEKKYGFDYATLDNHPERGIARFTVYAEGDSPSKIIFKIESWSIPGHWLSTLVKPFSIWMQRRATCQALSFFKSEVLSTIQKARSPQSDG